MSRAVDLNARRAARAEKQGEPPSVTLGDRTYVLAREIPLQFVELAEANDIRGSCTLLVGADYVDEFLANGITADDLSYLEGAYGQEPGESSASTDS